MKVLGCSIASRTEDADLAFYGCRLYLVNRALPGDKLSSLFLHLDLMLNFSFLESMQLLGLESSLNLQFMQLSFHLFDRIVEKLYYPFHMLVGIVVHLN